MKHLRFNLTGPLLPLESNSNPPVSPDLNLINSPEPSKLTLAARLKAMCCFPVADVFLEDPPPEKKEEKKDEKVKKNYVLVSDKLNIQPIVSQHYLFAPAFPSTLASPHNLSHHQSRLLVFLFEIGESIVLVSTSPGEAIRNGIPHGPAIHSPSWRTNNALPSHQSLDQPFCSHLICAAVKFVESMDSSSYCALVPVKWVESMGSSPCCYCTLFQRKSPLRLSASSAKQLDIPSGPHFVNFKSIRVEQPCCPQSIFRWQCKALPPASCPQPGDEPPSFTLFLHIPSPGLV